MSSTTNKDIKETGGELADGISIFASQEVVVEEKKERRKAIKKENTLYKLTASRIISTAIYEDEKKKRQLAKDIWCVQGEKSALLNALTSSSSSSPSKSVCSKLHLPTTASTLNQKAKALTGKDKAKADAEQLKKNHLNVGKVHGNHFLVPTRATINNAWKSKEERFELEAVAKLEEGIANIVIGSGLKMKATNQRLFEKQKKEQNTEEDGDAAEDQPKTKRGINVLGDPSPLPTIPPLSSSHSPTPAHLHLTVEATSDFILVDTASLSLLVSLPPPPPPTFATLDDATEASESPK